MTNYWHDIPAGADAPNQINVIIETPKGSQNKYEHDKEHNVIKLDRVLFSPVRFPGDYGLIPQTLAPDNDPLDALVIVTNRNYPGVLVEAKPIGMMKMIDNGEADDKIICVPVHDVRFSHVNDISEISEALKNEITHFFEVYKQLEKKKVEIGEWQNAAEAKNMITESMTAYKARYRDQE